MTEDYAGGVVLKGGFMGGTGVRRVPPAEGRERDGGVDAGAALNAGRLLLPFGMVRGQNQRREWA